MSLRIRSSSASDGARRRSERLTAEEEKAIAREILPHFQPSQRPAKLAAHAAGE